MIDKMFGFQFGNWGDKVLFFEFHPFGWGIGLYNDDTTSAITIGCFTIGFNI